MVTSEGRVTRYSNFSVVNKVVASDRFDYFGVVISRMLREPGLLFVALSMALHGMYRHWRQAALCGEDSIDAGDHPCNL